MRIAGEDERLAFGENCWPASETFDHSQRFYVFQAIDFGLDDFLVSFHCPTLNSREILLTTNKVSGANSLCPKSWLGLTVPGED